jgi:hypothetical protein
MSDELDTSTEEPKGRKSVATPEDQIHIIAAILAMGIEDKVEASTEKPMVALASRVQRYRHIVRMLKRGPDQASEQ